MIISGKIVQFVKKIGTFALCILEKYIFAKPKKAWYSKCLSVFHIQLKIENCF